MKILFRSMLVLLLIAQVLPVHAEVHEIPTEQLGSWVSSNSVLVPGTPETVYDAFVGDVTPWWDHSFSEKPFAMFIQPRPGGGFYEFFDEEGNGVLHATVLVAQRGKMLRLDGPLGLSGRALDFVTTLTFEAEGDSTRLAATAHYTGEIDSELASIVDGVWRHFIEERFKPWYEKGAIGKKPVPKL